MPLQNRVSPCGEILATTARGTFMGNRGILHDDQQRLTQRRWTTPAWIICALNFKGRKRELMASGKYTELFFLDEATALAAGHRPCGECRREDYKRFKMLFEGANAAALKADGTTMDKLLHHHRVKPYTRQKIVYQDNFTNLPDDVFIMIDDEPYRIQGDSLHHWTFGGYDRVIAKPSAANVTVLTPRPTVLTMLAGYSTD